MKNKILTSILFSFILLGLIFNYESTLIVFADIHNNDITRLEVYQYTLGSWKLLLNVTSTGQSCDIDANKAIRFNVTVRLNKTLADNDNEAIEYSKVLMNITNGGTVWNNKLLNNTDVSSDADWYYLIETGNWSSDLPSEGVEYTCTIRYEAYY